MSADFGSALVAYNARFQQVLAQLIATDNE